MSTKVISAKIPTEDYDKIVERCNEKGCSISDYVREQCLGFETKFEEDRSVNDQEVDRQETVSNFAQELKLSFAEDKIKKLESNLAEFSDLFTPKEINDRRICRSFSKFNH